MMIITAVKERAVMNISALRNLDSGNTYSKYMVNEAAELLALESPFSQHASHAEYNITYQPVFIISIS